MKVCFFGTYNASYARNVCLRDGLRELGVTLSEINKHVPKESLEGAEDFTFPKIMSRIYRKIKTSFWLLTQSWRLIHHDVIVALYPGTLDVPIAWLVTRIFKKQLVFDTSISLYDTMINDKKIAAKNSLKAKILKLFEQLLLHLPDKIFVDTKQMKKFIIKDFGIKANKIFVVPIGASNKVYFPKKQEKTEKVIQVFFFGYYNPLQGVRYIIRAIKLLQNEPNLHFTLVGDSIFRKEIIDYSKQNKLKNVTFIGVVPESELVSRLQQSDISLGVFSNIDIGRRVIPNKVFAALACAKPLITAQLPSVEPYLHHLQEVFYCKPEDPESLALAIKVLAKDKALRENIAKKGFQVYLNYFTPKILAGIFMENITKKTYV